MKMKTHSSKKKTENTLGAWVVTSYSATKKYIEQHCYVPNEVTFSIPLHYVDVMSHTRTSIDDASEHTLIDYWKEERGKLRSLWNGLERHDSTCYHAPRRIFWCKWSTHKSAEDDDPTPSGPKNGPDCQSDGRKTRLKLIRNKDSSRFHPKIRTSTR